MAYKPVPAQIDATWIYPFKKSDLLGTPPALELLLSSNRIPNVGKAFKVDQPIHSILFRKPWDEMLFVFKHPAFEIVRDTDLQRA